MTGMNVDKKTKTLCLIFLLVLVCASSAAAGGLPSHPNRDEIRKLDESSCADGFSFAVMADSHVSVTVFPKIVAMVDELKPDFALSAGDFTNDGLKEEYETFLGQIARTDVPWFTVPGNHEYRTPDGHTCDA